MSFYEKENIELEISQFTKIIKNNPNNSNLYFKRGMLNYKLGNYIDAINNFTKVIDLNPHEPVVLYNRGKTYSNMKKYHKAINDFTHAINLVPSNAACYYERAECYCKIYEYGSAFYDYSRAINLTSDNLIIYYKRAICSEKLKLFNDAINDYAIVANGNYDLKSNNKLTIYVSKSRSKLRKLQGLRKTNSLTNVSCQPLYNSLNEDTYYKNKIKELKETQITHFENFYIGTKVYHEYFGIGIVTSIENNRILVDFEHRGVIPVTKDICLEGVLISTYTEISLETLINKSEEMYKNHNNNIEAIRVNLRIINKLNSDNIEYESINKLKYLIRLAEAYNYNNMFLEAVGVYQKILAIKPRDKTALDYIEIHKKGEYHKQTAKPTDFQHELWSSHL